jgi:hypothetical protein
MTILAPSVAARPVEPPTSTTRQYIPYVFYTVRPTWRLAPPVGPHSHTRGRGDCDAPRRCVLRGWLDEKRAALWIYRT